MNIMSTYKKDFFNSVWFVILYVLPFPVFTFSTAEFVSVGFFILIIANFVLMLSDPSWYNRKNYKMISFAFMYVVLGLVTYFIKHSPPQLFLIPFMAIYAFHYIGKINFKFIVLDFTLIFLYVFYYKVYFNKLPDLFIHPLGFDENLFLLSSSNSIAISLNLILYIYVILSFLFHKGPNTYKKLLLYSIINIILIVIQQSRAGIFIAVLMFLIVLYEYSRIIQISKRVKYILLFVISAALISFSYMYISIIENYLEVVGNVNGLSAYDEDIRSAAAKTFFDNMDLYRFIIGYPAGYIYGTTELKYTYNTFLDVWNNYTIVAFVVLIVVVVRRCLHFKKYFFPVYFILPFLIYSMGEPRFLPNYWDFSIYLLLFKKSTIL